jgi:hypothetical protein
VSRPVAPPDAPPLYWRDGDDSDPSIVGRSTDALFVLDEGGSVWLAPEGPSPRLFVNSTTERFYESMAVFQPAWLSLDPDEDAATIMERVRDDLRRIDAAAFGDLQGFWSLVLEQVEDGLL